MAKSQREPRALWPGKLTNMPARSYQSSRRENSSVHLRLPTRPGQPCVHKARASGTAATVPTGPSSRTADTTSSLLGQPPTQGAQRCHRALWSPEGPEGTERVQCGRGPGSRERGRGHDWSAAPLGQGQGRADGLQETHPPPGGPGQAGGLGVVFQSLRGVVPGRGPAPPCPR